MLTEISSRRLAEPGFQIRIFLRHSVQTPSHSNHLTMAPLNNRVSMALNLEKPTGMFLTENRVVASANDLHVNENRER